MRQELDNKLCQRFPTIFRDRNADSKTTLMCYGFNCGDGWFQLIWDLCLELEKLHPKVVATQVKEKFGGLRFYYTTVEEELDGILGVSLRNNKAFNLISQAEARSYQICEWCGKPGSITKPKHWVHTLCSKCRKKEEKGQREGHWPWIK